jgi:hypothetical protein
MIGVLVNVAMRLLNYVVALYAGDAAMLLALPFMLLCPGAIPGNRIGDAIGLPTEGLIAMESIATGAIYAGATLIYRSLVVRGGWGRVLIGFLAVTYAVLALTAGWWSTAIQ